MPKGEPAQGMSAVRVSAVLTLLLLATYYALRRAAAECTGVQCDWYIAPSLLLPILILVVVGLTGFVACWPHGGDGATPAAGSGLRCSRYALRRA
jgi:hypothetical protein